MYLLYVCKGTVCGQKLELASLELEVRTIVNCRVAAENETRSSAKVKSSINV